MHSTEIVVVALLHRVGRLVEAAAERAAAAAGFDYFSIGVADKAAIEDLANRLTALGESHAGVHFASIGWILPDPKDPDEHEVRFYTVAQHTEVSDGVMTINDPRETAERREREVST